MHFVCMCPCVRVSVHTLNISTAAFFHSEGKLVSGMPLHSSQEELSPPPASEGERHAF